MSWTYGHTPDIRLTATIANSWAGDGGSAGLASHAPVEADLVGPCRRCGVRAPERDLGQAGLDQFEAFEEALDLGAGPQVQRRGGVVVDGLRFAAVGEVARGVRE